MAHGYLLHQFFSPISNLRKDEFGGNLKNRCRLLIEIARGVRNVWPKDKILGARINGKDWLKNGATEKDCIYLSRQLKKIGFNNTEINGILGNNWYNFYRKYIT